MDFRNKIREEQLGEKLRIARNVDGTVKIEKSIDPFEESRDKIEKSLNSLGELRGEKFVDEIEKSISHKYYKREGTPGKYKYYYTKEQYEAATQSPEEKLKAYHKKRLDDDLDLIRRSVKEPEWRDHKNSADAIGGEIYNMGLGKVVAALNFKTKIPKELIPKQFQSGYYGECKKLGKWMDEKMKEEEGYDYKSDKWDKKIGGNISDSAKRKARAALSVHLAASKDQAKEDDSFDEDVEEIKRARKAIMETNDWGEVCKILDEHGYDSEDIEGIIGKDPDED